MDIVTLKSTNREAHERKRLFENVMSVCYGEGTRKG